MTGLSPGGGWAGHPDLMGQAAALLKVTAVGRDPLRTAAHGGGSDSASSDSQKGNERNTPAGSVCGFLHFTASLSALSDRQPILRFYTSIACHAPAPFKTTQFMSQHLWNLEPLHQCSLDLLLRYLSAACEELIWAGIAANGISGGFTFSPSAIYRE